MTKLLWKSLSLLNDMTSWATTLIGVTITAMVWLGYIVIAKVTDHILLIHLNF